ncbi:hypothetical protein [Actinoplanes aureus]|jgi:hypothetical protein|uniref:Uncharacterized protein n=1 Tax=Actinoplanes aureus TaxID=2792083 RepID=A0A931G4L2_9ACTN|nr:hypothetical protein [Actinoplanes aureus]MBG0565394.1 hypothetical protein [Actinoplanes aureus]
MMRIATVIGLLAAGAAVAAGVAVGGANLACEPERGRGSVIYVVPEDLGTPVPAADELSWPVGEADL